MVSSDIIFYIGVLRVIGILVMPNVCIKDSGQNEDVIVGDIYKPPKDHYDIEHINTLKNSN